MANGYGIPIFTTLQTKHTKKTITVRQTHKSNEICHEEDIKNRQQG